MYVCTEHSKTPQMRVRNYKKKTEESERKKLAPNKIASGNETPSSLRYKTQHCVN